MNSSSKCKVKLISLVMAILLITGIFSACKLSENEIPGDTAAPSVTAKPADTELDGTMVVMHSKNVDMTLYDFGQSFYSSQYFQYYMYGMMTPDEYCDAVIEETCDFMRIVNAGIDDGIELTPDDLDEIDKTIEEQLEQILQRYEESVEDGVEDKRAEAKKLLEEDLTQDGIDYDSFIDLAKNNIRMYTIASKYYQKLSDSMEVDDEDIVNYIKEQVEAEQEMSMSDFVAKFNDYISGNGPSPASFPKDCFSVNHIYMGFETGSDDSGNVVYDKNSRSEDEAKIEERLPELAGFAEFMELENEFGEDPGMDDETMRKYGYMIHPDIENDYFAGFVYAAMNLHDGEWKRPADPDSEEEYTDPELLSFTLKDGTKVVKVYTESGVHYLIVNREYEAGEISYEKGDERWESWKSYISNKLLAEEYEKLNEQWKEAYPIEVDSDTIKAKYSVVEEPDANKK